MLSQILLIANIFAQTDSFMIESLGPQLPLILHGAHWQLDCTQASCRVRSILQVENPATHEVLWQPAVDAKATTIRLKPHEKVEVQMEHTESIGRQPRQTRYRLFYTTDALLTTVFSSVSWNAAFSAPYSCKLKTRISGLTTTPLEKESDCSPFFNSPVVELAKPQRWLALDSILWLDSGAKEKWPSRWVPN